MIADFFVFGILNLIWIVAIVRLSVLQRNDSLLREVLTAKLRLAYNEA